MWTGYGLMDYIYAFHNLRLIKQIKKKKQKVVTDMFSLWRYLFNFGRSLWCQSFIKLYHLIHIKKKWMNDCFSCFNILSYKDHNRKSVVLLCTL